MTKTSQNTPVQTVLT